LPRIIRFLLLMGNLQLEGRASRFYIEASLQGAFRVERQPCPRANLAGGELLKYPDYTPSEVAHNPFGINRPQKCAFIPIGGPQAHGDS